MAWDMPECLFASASPFGMRGGGNSSTSHSHCEKGEVLPTEQKRLVYQKV